MYKYKARTVANGHAVIQTHENWCKHHIDWTHDLLKKYGCIHKNERCRILFVLMKDFQNVGNDCFYLSTPYIIRVTSCIPLRKNGIIVPHLCFGISVTKQISTIRVYSDCCKELCGCFHLSFILGTERLPGLIELYLLPQQRISKAISNLSVIKTCNCFVSKVMHPPYINGSNNCIVRAWQ